MWTCRMKYVIYVTHDVNVQNHTEFTIIHHTLYVHTIHVYTCITTVHVYELGYHGY